MRGRWPSGREYVDKLSGSAETKERLKTIFDTMYGEKRLLEACAQLDIGETRFHQLRELALQAALAAIEPTTRIRNQIMKPIGETISGNGERKDIMPIM